MHQLVNEKTLIISRYMVCMCGTHTHTHTNVLVVASKETGLEVIVDKTWSCLKIRM